MGSGAKPSPKSSFQAYLSSTLAPASSSFFLMSSASALETASLTAFGAPSTRSLASLRPRPVMARTSLMTLILFSPRSARMTSNSVFSLQRSSSSGSAAGGSNSHRSSGGNAPLLFEHLDSSAASRTVRAERSSTILARSAIFVSSFRSVRTGGFEQRRTALAALRPSRREPKDTRASWPAGACKTEAMRVAGVLEHARELRAQLVQRRHRGERLDCSASSPVVPMAPPRTTNFWFLVAKADATFGAVMGSLAIGDDRLTGEEIRDLPRSVSLRASLARRFLATLTVPPARSSANGSRSVARL